ncbi:hypothetical protein RHGRI_017515 [Rhododendron griersonianum]|uniref:Uncharacterized protein n=1 Tax=Rhododendron griersonianum TaxID=479676 RepID=A0AAV6JY43_9ERIC|nr:hypothetical protein RHGRI_017515 [Rhododendron griersonianum]
MVSSYVNRNADNSLIARNWLAKVLEIDVRGELMEGNTIRGYAEVACPVTGEGVKGEPQYAITDIVKAGHPSVNDVQIIGEVVEGEWHKVRRRVVWWVGGEEFEKKEMKEKHEQGLGTTPLNNVFFHDFVHCVIADYVAFSSDALDDSFVSATAIDSEAIADQMKN